VNVYLSRLSESPADIHEQVSLLRIPWTAILPGSLQFQTQICQNLSSLALEESRSHWDWRKILSRPAQNLKQLSLRLNGSSEGLAPLHFPQMEELEISEDHMRFPSWIIVPPTTKAESIYAHSDLPSIVFLPGKTSLTGSQSHTLLTFHVSSSRWKTF